MRHVQQVRDATNQVLLVLVHRQVGVRHAPQRFEQPDLLCLGEGAVDLRGELVQVVRLVDVTLGLLDQRPRCVGPSPSSAETEAMTCCRSAGATS